MYKRDEKQKLECRYFYGILLWWQINNIVGNKWILTCNLIGYFSTILLVKCFLSLKLSFGELLKFANLLDIQILDAINFSTNEETMNSLYV